MAYLTKVVERDDPSLQLLLHAALAEEGNDCLDRLTRINWSVPDYWRHIDERAELLNQPITYLAVAGDGSDPAPVGFARFTVETTLPGMQSLPGDYKTICLDEVFVAPPFRNRGAFAVLIDGVRKMAQAQGVYWVYARVLNGPLQRAFMRYGMKPTPVFVGQLHKLRLPEPTELSRDTGDWSTRRLGWREGEGAGAIETGPRTARKSELSTRSAQHGYNKGRW